LQRHLAGRQARPFEGRGIRGFARELVFSEARLDIGTVDDRGVVRCRDRVRERRARARCAARASATWAVTSPQGFLTREALANIAATTLANITAFQRGDGALHRVPEP
jgi:hypothetical protein